MEGGSEVPDPVPNRRPVISLEAYRELIAAEQRTGLGRPDGQPRYCDELSPSPRAHAKGKPDGIVLIHGAYHGAWVWQRLVPLLQLPVLSVDLPGRGSSPLPLASLSVMVAAEAVRSAILEAGMKRVILVGHSLAGGIAYTVAVNHSEMVSHLVGVAAIFPPRGRSALDLWPPGLRWLAKVRRSLLSRGFSRPLRLSERTARARLANDLSPEDGDWLVSNLVPESPRLELTPVSEGILPVRMPRTYVICGRDRALRVSLQQRQARRLGGSRIELDTGHDPMVGAPAALARILNGLDGRKVG